MKYSAVRFQNLKFKIRDPTAESETPSAEIQLAETQGGETACALRPHYST